MPHLVNRREFIQSSALAGLGLGLAGPSLLGDVLTPPASNLTPRSANRLPRWRGFNLVEMVHPGGHASFSEADFRWIADWGFDHEGVPAFQGVDLGPFWPERYSGRPEAVGSETTIASQSEGLNRVGLHAH